MDKPIILSHIVTHITQVNPELKLIPIFEPNQRSSRRLLILPKNNFLCYDSHHQTQSKDVPPNQPYP